MGAMQRRKGKEYERAVALILRSAFPAADVRRTSQADRAGNSDVIVTGSPLLEQLWLELNDARAPNPLAKLEQAERDIELAAPSNRIRRLPVVIWHRIRERSHQVTTRLWVLDSLRAVPPAPCDGAAVVVTMELQEFIGLLGAGELGP